MDGCGGSVVAALRRFGSPAVASNHAWKISGTQDLGEVSFGVSVVALTDR